ncbi:hypothetical protein [Vibrio sp.]|uniref:hypothetical protein n=1 Tax=Vibrio sp. TaxID=678 RepID=UPI0031203188
MNLSKKSVVSIFASALLMASSQSVASSDCQWLESVIEPSTPLVIDYDTNHLYGNNEWDTIKKFNFDFGYDKVENPRSLSVRVYLAKPTTEAMSISGELEGANGSNGGSNRAGRTELHMNLNDTRYFSRLRDGKLHLGLGRSGSVEPIEVVKMTAKFCGVPVQGVSLNPTDNNVLLGAGEPLTHYIDADTTYRVSIQGEAADENGNIISSVSVNYVDPRNSKNTTLQLNTNDEFYVHSGGKVSLYYAVNSAEFTGGHTVKFERVNLD